MKIKSVGREILVYALLLVAGYLLVLIFYPLIFLVQNKDIVAFLRYLLNTHMLSVWPQFGFLALAVRRSKRFGCITGAVIAIACIIPGLPDIPVYLQLSRVEYYFVFAGLLSGVLQVVICFGVAMICRLIQSDLIAFLLSIVAPACYSFFALISGLRTGMPFSIHFVSLLFEIGFALMLYPICLLLKKLFLRSTPAGLYDMGSMLKDE